jgi:uncharacterized repeat protein (TIGR03847 family)
MAKIEIDLNPVTHITTDAIGKPGSRVFYLQATQAEQVVTLLIEKVQIQSLAVGVEQFLAELSQKYPDLPDASPDYGEEEMRITPPVDPLFRVGELGLGYDNDRDLVVLVAREVTAEGTDAEEMGVVRLWCTRSQVRALCHWGVEVVNRGRPICPQCGEPMDPAGHFCPKKNGHKH